jgi:thiamine thiazole synthase
MAGLHVDPLAIRAKAVIDCTGHDAEVLSIASRKIPQLNITIQGESSMWVSRGEELVVEKTGRVCPGLYVAGMSVAAVYGIPRMGPIFGGMLLSGKRVAELVIEDLRRLCR